MRNRTLARGRRVTITQIAAELGVTPTTVSNAFSRPDQLSPALRARILETAAAMGYTGPDPAARSMRRGRLPAVGVLYSDRLSNAFVDSACVLFFQGVAAAAEDVGLGMTLIPGAPAEARDPAAVGAAVVDGFIIYSMADDDPLVPAALTRRLPVVVADSPRLSGVPYVGIDDEAAARRAAKYLLELGHRHFGILSGELLLDRRNGPTDPARQAAATYGVNRARLHGYRAALTTAGLDWEQIPVEEVAEGVEREARAATARLLARRPRPTAILVMSDRMALEVIAAGQDAGLTIPDDLSVVGFDDIAEAARATPPLTTVRQHHVEKGHRVGELLIARLCGEAMDEVQILPTELVLRGSTASPR